MSKSSSPVNYIISIFLWKTSSRWSICPSSQMIKVWKLNYTRCCNSINTIMALLSYTCNLYYNSFNELSALSSKKKRLSHDALCYRGVLHAAAGQAPAMHPLWEAAQELRAAQPRWVGAFCRAGGRPRLGSSRNGAGGAGPPGQDTAAVWALSVACRLLETLWGEWVPIPIT